MQEQKSKILRSRDAWKKKATHRGERLRGARKRSKKHRRKYAGAIQEIHRLRAELVALRAASPVPQHVPAEGGARIQTKTLCVLIVITAVVSFRSVPRILRIFNPLLWGKVRIPHFTSVINWTVRVGVGIFRQVAMLADGRWVGVIDSSIDIGTRKALVVLRVLLTALKDKQGAIGPRDCECIGLEVSHCWNGELVCEALDRIFRRAGMPAAIIKDGGTDLNKGVASFCAQHPEKPIHIIDDVGHFAANTLKARFAETNPFRKFTEIVSKGAARIRQTTLAWLLPPKIRTKGRFQSISQIADWAVKALDLLGGKGKANDGDRRKARQAFAGLSGLRPFLVRFCHTCFVTELFLELLKTAGLNEVTYARAKEILKKLPRLSPVRIRLSSWLEKHIDIHRRLGIGDLPLLVSSDCIESLFGMFKTIVQRNPQAELNRLLYVIPALCGNLHSSDIHRALQECSHSQMAQHIQRTIPPTLRQLRARQLKKLPAPVPKSGSFSNLNSG